MRKKHLLRRLEGLNWAVSHSGMLPKYENLQLELWKELEDVLLQELLLWAQKARAEWSILGDCNTCYFHARANHRRKAKRIEAIKNNEGEWVFDVAQIKGLATTFFSNLLSEDVMVRPELQCTMTFRRLDEDMLKWYSRDVTEHKEAIFSMGSLKAPGLDGFNALFYQNQWSTVSAYVVTYVKFLFANP